MSERVEAPALCEMEGCRERAVADVHAQWTIADFVSYQACPFHVWDMCDGLGERPVEGRVPADVWVVWFDTGERL
jgi:hypothetical protein